MGEKWFVVPWWPVMAVALAVSAVASGRISGLLCSFRADAELCSQSTKCSAIRSARSRRVIEIHGGVAADVETVRHILVLADGTAADPAEQQSESPLSHDDARMGNGDPARRELCRSRPAFIP